MNGPDSTKNVITIIYAMRIYQVIMTSGAKIDVLAELVYDDPANHDVIYFYRDEGKNLLAASFIRAEVAGMILGSETSSAVPRFAHSRAR